MTKKKKKNTKNILKEMAWPDEEIVRLTIHVQHSPTQQWATTEDDVEEVWHNVKKIPAVAAVGYSIGKSEDQRRQLAKARAHPRMVQRSTKSKEAWTKDGGNAESNPDKPGKDRSSKRKGERRSRSTRSSTDEEPRKGPQIVNREAIGEQTRETRLMLQQTGGRRRNCLHERSCHQWNNVEKVTYYWHPEKRSVSKRIEPILNSADGQVFGSMARTVPDTNSEADSPQAIRKTVNDTGWSAGLTASRANRESKTEATTCCKIRRSVMSSKVCGKVESKVH